MTGVLHFLVCMWLAWLSFVAGGPAAALLLVAGVVVGWIAARDGLSDPVVLEPIGTGLAPHFELVDRNDNRAVVTPPLSTVRVYAHGWRQSDDYGFKPRVKKSQRR